MYVSVYVCMYVTHTGKRFDDRKLQMKHLERLAGPKALRKCEAQMQVICP